MAAHQRINWGSMAGRRRARAVRTDDQPELPLRATPKKPFSSVLERSWIAVFWQPSAFSERTQEEYRKEYDTVKRCTDPALIAPHSDAGSLAFPKKEEMRKMPSRYGLSACNHD